MHTDITRIALVGGGEEDHSGDREVGRASALLYFLRTDEGAQEAKMSICVLFEAVIYYCFHLL